MKKILLSVLTIGVVAVVAVVATQAFFSDTETSVGNTFVAGAIDLKVDNHSYALDYNIPGFQNPTGAFVANTANSWTISDLTLEKFFNFVDLKPGDYGEDTISLHVNTNPAWVCAAAKVNVNSDETCTSSENAAVGGENGNCVTQVDGQDGDLAQQVNFAFWKDDGDNVYEEGEGTPFLTGPVSSLNGAGQIALADTTANSVWGQNTPIPGNTDVFIGKEWCFGTLTPTPLTQDGINTGTPLTRQGTGFTCNGSAVDNKAQTDKVVGDLQFYAVQSRNNATFSCAEWTPVWPVRQ